MDFLEKKCWVCFLGAIALLIGVAPAALADDPNGSASDACRVGPWRDADGNLQPNSYFPDLKALADCIHAKGLMAGLYTSPGPRTCTGVGGASQHEVQDARQFAGCGFDFLKYDWCSHRNIAGTNKSLETFQKSERLMGGWLKQHKRDIVVNLCPLWCLMAAPLFFSGDLQHLDEFTLNVRCNPEVIDVDQDPLGRLATVVHLTPQTFLVINELADGTKAVGLFTQGEAPAPVAANWSAIGVKEKQLVRDLWRQPELGTFTNEFSAEIPRHGVSFVRLQPAK